MERTNIDDYHDYPSEGTWEIYWPFLHQVMPVSVLSIRGYWEISHLDPFSGLPTTPKQFLTLGFNCNEIYAILGKYLVISQNFCFFLQVTQILIGFICLYFGTIVYPGITISEFEKNFFSSFQIGYPFWGAVLVSIRVSMAVLEITLLVALLLPRPDLPNCLFLAFILYMVIYLYYIFAYVCSL